MHPTRNLFAEFKCGHKIFVETGSYRGDAIQLAIDAGFEKIISIDCDPANIEFCINRFDLRNKPDDRISLFVGDSVGALPGILEAMVDEPAMFWLDAHAQHLEGEEESENPYPLLEELGIIANEGQPGNTIIIDDMLHLTHPSITGWSRHEIKMAAQLAVRCGHTYESEIKIEFFANPVKDSILVAHV